MEVRRFFLDVWALNFLSSKRKWRSINNQIYGREFLERYHHTINRTKEGIIIFGGRRADHTLCLYVEEGIDRGKFIRTCENNRQKQLTLKAGWSDEMLVTWIKSIYNGKKEKSEEFNKFVERYSEVIQNNNATQKLITDLAVDVGIFSDIRFLFSDNSEVPFHRAFLLANTHETSSLIHVDYQTILQAGPESVFKIPFNFPEFSALKLFLYTNQVDLTTDNVWKILELSLRMGSRDNLTKICEKFIWKNNVLWGVYKILKEAERVGSKDLKNWAVWYLSVNFAAHQKTKKFKKIRIETQEEIIKKQWPGEDYNKKQKEWSAEREKAKKSNCLVQ